MRAVKRFESGMVVNPITMTPDQTLAEAFELMKQPTASAASRSSRRRANWSASSPTATSASPKTRAAGARADDPRQSRHRPDRHQPGGRAPHPPPAADREIAGGRRGRPLRRPDHRQGHRESRSPRPLATKDGEGRLRVAAATTVGDAGFARSEALIDAGVDCIVIDTAHGHNVEVARAVERVKKRVELGPGRRRQRRHRRRRQGARRCRRRRDQGRHRPGLDLHHADRRRGRRAAAFARSWRPRRPRPRPASR